MNWEAELGNFMRENKHYSIKEITKLIIIPSLEKLTTEFNRYDNFLAEMFERTDNESHKKTFYFKVSPNRYPDYFKFMICVWFEEGRLILKNKSKNVWYDLADLLPETNTDSFGKTIKWNTDSIEIDELFEIDYLAAIISGKFKAYYQSICKLNNSKSIEIQR